jgi:hypothetical protein
MAVYGISNVVETLRLQRMPYWKIYRTQTDRDAGNVIAAADFENPNLGMEESCARLNDMLRRQTPGKYIMTAFKSPGQSKGGISTDIEVEYTGINNASGIGGTAANANSSAFVVDGIGVVTPENIGEVVEKKFKELEQKKKEEERIRNMEAENKRLKLEARQYESGINRGLLSIGSLVWNMMRGTDAGKEVIGMINEFKKYNGNAAAHTPAPGAATDKPASEYEESNVIEPDEATGRRMASALDTLAENNNELVQQLEMLARVKKENPDLFNEAVDNLKTFAG